MGTEDSRTNARIHTGRAARGQDGARRSSEVLRDARRRLTPSAAHAHMAQGQPSLDLRAALARSSQRRARSVCRRSRWCSRAATAAAPDRSHPARRCRQAWISLRWRCAATRRHPCARACFPSFPACSGTRVHAGTAVEASVERGLLAGLGVDTAIRSLTIGWPPAGTHRSGAHALAPISASREAGRGTTPGPCRPPERRRSSPIAHARSCACSRSATACSARSSSTRVRTSSCARPAVRCSGQSVQKAWGRGPRVGVARAAPCPTQWEPYHDGVTLAACDQRPVDGHRHDEGDHERCREAAPEVSSPSNAASVPL